MANEDPERHVTIQYAVVGEGAERVWSVARIVTEVAKNGGAVMGQTIELLAQQPANLNVSREEENE